MCSRIVRVVCINFYHCPYHTVPPYKYRQAVDTINPINQLKSQINQEKTSIKIKYSRSDNHT